MTGQRIAIVGGSSGMGRATAALLASRGDRVAIVGRDAGRATAAAAACSDGAAHPVGGFASLGEAIAFLGGLEGLVVTAGPIARQARFDQLSDEDWLESFDTQLMTVVRSVRAALPALLASKGALVTVAAYSIRAPKPQLAHYAAMKAAIASLTKNLALTYGGEGLRANCIAPGAIATAALDGATAIAMARTGLPAEQALARHMVDEWGMNVALGRAGQPSEAAELIAFLISPRASYLTGALINLDGGTHF